MPTTLGHGDFNIGNLLWDKTGEPGTVWVVDWQSTAIEPPILDIGWFLGTGVAKTDLHFIRQDYLPGYQSALVCGGVTHY